MSETSRPSCLGNLSSKLPGDYYECKDLFVVDSLNGSIDARKRKKDPTTKLPEPGYDRTESKQTKGMKKPAEDPTPRGEDRDLALGTDKYSRRLRGCIEAILRRHGFRVIIRAETNAPLRTNSWGLQAFSTS